MGATDENHQETLERWIKEWTLFFTKSKLHLYAKSSITWKILFEDIIEYTLYNPEKIFGIFIDEIQWLAKSRTGFVSQLKEAWLDLEKKSQLKMIICGSSNKFFHDYTGGEEKILRGLCTHDDIWLMDFSFKTLHENYGNSWTLEETCFAQMCLGGVPYYWNQFPEDQSFIGAFNQTCFTSGTILLKEASEMLRLEFNDAGITTVLKIMQNLGQQGQEIAEVARLSKLPVSTVTDTIQKLLNYNLIFEKQEFKQSVKKNKRGILYTLKDLYLNFYFQVLLPQQRKIKNNITNQLLFSQILSSKKGYYIENFSGYAFERLVTNVLEQQFDRNQNIFTEMGIGDCDYQISSYNGKDAQIDIVLDEATDRIIRFIECRWTQNIQTIYSLIDDLENKSKLFSESNGVSEPAGFSASGRNSLSQPKKLYIITNCQLTKEVLNKAKSKKVRLLNLESLL
jgi:hypothetical protein